MSTPSSGPWVLAALLRPAVFVLAIVAGVMTGNRTGTFWLGLLAYLIAMSAGRALRTLLRGRVTLTVYRAIWPASAAGYAFLFGYLGMPGWANLIVTVIAAGMTKNALGGPIRPQRTKTKWEWGRLDEWGMPDVDQIRSGRWKEL